MTESLVINQPDIYQSPLTFAPSPRKLYQINADGSE